MLPLFTFLLAVSKKFTEMDYLKLLIVVLFVTLKFKGILSVADVGCKFLVLDAKVFVIVEHLHAESLVYYLLLSNLFSCIDRTHLILP